MIGPAVLVEELHDDGKLIAYDGCAELDDMVSNAFRSSMMTGCRFSNSQYAANDSRSDVRVWELDVVNGGRGGVNPEGGGVPAGDLGFTIWVRPSSRSSSAMTSAGSFRFSRTALACLRRLLTVTVYFPTNGLDLSASSRQAHIRSSSSTADCTRYEEGTRVATKHITTAASAACDQQNPARTRNPGTRSNVKQTPRINRHADRKTAMNEGAYLCLRISPGWSPRTWEK